MAKKRKPSPFNSFFRSLDKFKDSVLSKTTVNSLVKDFMGIFNKQLDRKLSFWNRLTTTFLTSKFRKFLKTDFEKENKGIKSWRAKFVSDDLRKILKDKIHYNSMLLGDSRSEVALQMRRRLLGALAGNEDLSKLKELLKPMTQLAKEDKRVKRMVTDQSRKMVADFNEIVADKYQAIGFVWKNMDDKRVVGNPAGLYPDADDNSKAHGDHWSRQGKFYFYENSWAVKEGLINKNSKDFRWAKFNDGLPGKPINCRCFAHNYYDLEDIKDKWPSLISSKGENYITSQQV